MTSGKGERRRLRIAARLGEADVIGTRSGAVLSGKSGEIAAFWREWGRGKEIRGTATISSNERPPN